MSVLVVNCRTFVKLFLQAVYYLCQKVNKYTRKRASQASKNVLPYSLGTGLSASVHLGSPDLISGKCGGSKRRVLSPWLPYPSRKLSLPAFSLLFEPVI